MQLGVEPLKGVWYIFFMPAKYVVRDFSENSYYHVFNRGVEKRKIFLDEQDYNLFTYYLLIYLLPLDKVLEIYPKLPLRLHNKNLSGEVELLSYCLMPNHFHLLFKQKSKNGITKLLKQITNGYTLYFNNKYNRVGGLMQGRFKAVRIPTDEALLHVSRYIHLNPIASSFVVDLNDYEWSSYKDYIGKGDITFVSTNQILSFFNSNESYKEFMQDQIEYAKELEKIKHLVIDY